MPGYVTLRRVDNVVRVNKRQYANGILQILHYVKEQYANFYTYAGMY